MLKCEQKRAKSSFALPVSQEIIAEVYKEKVKTRDIINKVLKCMEVK